MKKLLLVISCLISINAYPQSITNTLGTGGLFTIKDSLNTYLTLSQPTGQVNILRNLRLENTTTQDLGIIFKGGSRFIHDYKSLSTFGQNIFIGINAGNFSMSGIDVQASYNTVVGNMSLNENTTGSGNTALGFQSLLFNTTGSANTSIGMQSLSYNTTGYENTSVGIQSMLSNISGFQNLAVGYQSLYYNSSGYINTAIGFQSLHLNTTGSENTSVGYQSLYSGSTSSENTAVGFQTLYSNTAGYGIYTAGRIKKQQTAEVCSDV